MVAAVIDEVHALALEARDQRGEVLVAGVDAFEHRDLDALVFERLLDGGGDAFTVLLLVVDDRDVLRLDVVGNEVAGGRALQAVQADGAEDQLVTARSDLGAGRGGGDHQDAFVLVDIGRRLRGAGTQVADHELHAVVDDLVCHRDGLLRVTGVVVANAFQLLAVHPAGLVDLLDGHLGTDELHVAILSDRTRHRAGQGDADGIRGERVAGGTAQAMAKNSFDRRCLFFISAPLASF